MVLEADPVLDLLERAMRELGTDAEGDSPPVSHEIAALEMASHFHPIWDRLKQGAKKLHARNCHQVLGGELNSRADLIVCWTPDGGIDGSSSKSGGTGMALRIAAAYGPVGVINLANENHLSYAQKMMSPFVFKDRKIS